MTDPVTDGPNAWLFSPDADATRESRLMTPLQAEMLEDGVLPDQDALGSSMGRHDVAIGAGYGDVGPSRLPGPDSTPAPDADERRLRVLQWEIDPADAAPVSGETDVRLGEWDFAI